MKSERVTLAESIWLVGATAGRGGSRGGRVGAPPGLAQGPPRGGGRMGPGRGQGPPPQPRAPPVPVPREDFNFEEAFQKFKKEVRHLYLPEPLPCVQMQADI